MTLKGLIVKLQGKPDQDAEVEFLVFEKDTGTLVCVEINGPATRDVMQAIVKHAKAKQ